MCLVSAKSIIDWFVQFQEGYRPKHTGYFTYYLGAKACVGYIQSDGLLYFGELNTTDTLFCDISFPIL
jgi:hypothetical protein